MAKYAINDSTLTDIANSIRIKTGITGFIVPEDMGARILGISGSGGGDIALQIKNVEPSETAQQIKPDSGYGGLSQVNVGAISENYVGSGVTRKSAQSYTPGTTNQNIASGQYLTGTQTIKGDTNLKAENIKSGVNIFGVTGNYKGTGGVTVQRKSGSFNYNVGTDYEVNCGFVPDLVFIEGVCLDDYSGYPVAFNAAFAFAEDSRTDAYSNHVSYMQTPEIYGAYMREVLCWQIANGFGISTILYDENWNQSSTSIENIKYVAVKYT